MLRLDYASGSDSDGEFQPLLRLLERNPSHTSLEFIEDSYALSPNPTHPTDTNRPTFHPCPCCQVNQSNFYCPDCIASCFSPAGPESLPQRLAALSLSLQRGRDLRERIRPRLERETDRQQQQQLLIRLQVTLRAQRRALAQESERVRVGRNRLRQLSSRNSRRESQLTEAAKQSFSEYIQECEERCSASRGRLSRLSEELTQIRRVSLQEVQTHCFLIRKLAAAARAPAPAASPRQDYVWVDPGGERYAILDSCLPPASNYVPKLCSPPLEPSLSNETARTTTLAALSHAAQLLQNIACILDTLLAEQVSFHTFNRADTDSSSAQLCSAATLLENSIVYLSASQGVPPDLLLKGHALENLLTLLNPRNPRLGQRHAFSPYPDLFLRETQLTGSDLSPGEGPVRSRAVSTASDSDSDWEDLEKSVSLSYSCEREGGTPESEASRSDVTRSRFLSFFWRSATDADK